MLRIPWLKQPLPPVEEHYPLDEPVVRMIVALPQLTDINWLKKVVRTILKDYAGRAAVLSIIQQEQDPADRRGLRGLTIDVANAAIAFMNKHPVLAGYAVFFTAKSDCDTPRLPRLWTTRVLTSRDFDVKSQYSPRERWMDKLRDEGGERSPWPTNCPAPEHLYSHCTQHIGPVFKVTLTPLSPRTEWAFAATSAGWTASVQFFSVEDAKALEDYAASHAILGWSVDVKVSDGDITLSQAQEQLDKLSPTQFPPTRVQPAMGTAPARHSAQLGTFSSPDAVQSSGDDLLASTDSHVAVENRLAQGIAYDHPFMYKPPVFPSRRDNDNDDNLSDTRLGQSPAQTVPSEQEYAQQ